MHTPITGGAVKTSSLLILFFVAGAVGVFYFLYGQWHLKRFAEQPTRRENLVTFATTTTTFRHWPWVQKPLTHNSAGLPCYILKPADYLGLDDIEFSYFVGGGGGLPPPSGNSRIDLDDLCIEYDSTLLTRLDIIQKLATSPLGLQLKAVMPDLFASRERGEWRQEAGRLEVGRHIETKSWSSLRDNKRGARFYTVRIDEPSGGACYRGLPTCVFESIAPSDPKFADVEASLDIDIDAQTGSVLGYERSSGFEGETPVHYFIDPGFFAYLEQLR